MVSAGRESAAAAPAPLLRRQRGMLPYYAYRTAETLVSVLPRRTAYWLGDRVADTLLAVAPHNLDPLRDNLRHVLPHASERTLRRTVRRNLRNLTHSWIDVMEMSARKANLPSRLDIEDFEIYHRAMMRGRGVVIASMHYGSWEAGLAAWCAMGGDLSLLAEVLHPPQLFERVIGARGKQRVHVIPIDVSAIRNGDAHTARRIGAASMREVFRVLRSGGSIAIAVDRDLIGNGEPLPFFGAPAPMPIGGVEIAIRAGAAIVPVILYRNDRRVRAVVYPEVRYSEEAPRDAEVRRVMQELIVLFERVILEHPDQWHVLDHVWQP
jgi:phosphatidylinositol dimannoside acyltransferase